MISEEKEETLATRKTKGSKGGGTIRQRPDGRWEARYTLGIDPGTGKQIQKSVYGKTQKEVRQKLTAITAEIDNGTYQEPCKMTVNEWLDIWLKDYQIGVKDSTAYLYERQAKLYLRPALGNIPLETLKAHTVQRLYNSLSQEHDGQPALSAKTIKNIHGVMTRRPPSMRPVPVRLPGTSRLPCWTLWSTVMVLSSFWVKVTVSRFRM